MLNIFLKINASFDVVKITANVCVSLKDVLSGSRVVFSNSFVDLQVRRKLFVSSIILVFPLIHVSACVCHSARIRVCYYFSFFSLV